MTEFEDIYETQFDKEFKKMTRGIEDHNFRHRSNALNMMIYSKEQFKYEMKKRRMVPYDMAEQFAEEYDKRHPKKSYDTISPRAMNIIKSLKLTADKNGNIVLGNRAIDALTKIGAMPASMDHAPKEFTGKGGFH